jgi:hypothetical protein
MQPQYRASVERSCEQCRIVFRVPNNRIAAGRGRFCSVPCRKAFSARDAMTACPACTVIFRARKERLRERGAQFCSRVCQFAARLKFLAPQDQKFWDRLSPNGECREWSGSRDPRGYGRVGWRGKVVLTHRLAWELAHGAIPSGLLVLHHCDNPPCCEPSHLFIGTQSDNIQDMLAKGRGPWGHAGTRAIKRSSPS